MLDLFVVKQCNAPLRPRHQPTDAGSDQDVYDSTVCGLSCVVADDAKPGDTPSLTAVIDDLVEDVLRADIIGLVVPEWKEGNVLTRLKNLLKQITGFALPLVLQDSFSQWETDEELGREVRGEAVDWMACAGAPPGSVW